jgi:hypothetical protein
MKKHKTSQHRSLSEGRYTVTMLDDVNTTTSSGRIDIYHAPRDVSKPALCEGFHLPNRFRIDGFHVPVEMNVAAVNIGGRFVMGCTALTIQPDSDSGSLKAVERMPVATWVSMAVKCARIVCMYYPAGYDGNVLDHRFRAVNARIVVNDSPFIEPLTLTPPKGFAWSDSPVSLLVGKPPQRKNNAITDEHLQEVADVYNAAKSYKNIAVRTSFSVTKRTADNWIAKCKELGYIETTKKREKQ